MSRSVDCLVDAGCYSEFSNSQTPSKGLKRIIRGLIDTIDIWYERSRQRREIRGLANDIDLLDDIGLSYYDLQREGRKPFWRE